MSCTASGKHYYANRSTGETRWEPPLPPPPPPPPRFSMPPPPHPGISQSQNMAQNQPNAVLYQQPPFNPNFPPPSTSVDPNTMSIGHNNLQFPPPQPIIPNQTNNITQAGQNMQQTIIPTTGKVGYQFDASTATTPGLLVQSVRSMMNTELSKNPLPKLELEGLTAGAIADLCNVTSEFKAKTSHIDKGDFATNEGQTQTSTTDDVVNQYYLPLEPFALPVSSRPQHIEAGRLDIRLHALYTKLNRI